MEHDLGIAGTYARALLGLAEPRGEAERVGGELAGIAALLEADAGLASFFASPLVGPETRRAALERALRGRVSDLLVDALQVAGRKGRLGLVKEIAAAYRRELDALRGRVEVRVTTAVPLGADLRERLRQAAGRLTGRQVALVERVDPALIGGLVLAIGDRKIDSSVAAQLLRLGRSLVERAAREIHGGRVHVDENRTGV